ncbi:MAG: DUF962 domain-containing protein [Armatimonadetes bacterium]|nr:DUF962 domain-containing protein [Armatimonadota bacterium]
MDKRRPAFFEDPVYLMVGPLWVAREIATTVRGLIKKEG